jgi:hypothetical protein
MYYIFKKLRRNNIALFYLVKKILHHFMNKFEVKPYTQE